jgi:rare lipoprotein A
MKVIGLPQGLRVVLLSLIATSCASAGQVAFNDPFTATDRTAEAANKATLASNDDDKIAEVAFDRGVASWYGPGFHGRMTANGETYDQEELTAAHKTLPFNTLVRVENVRNGKSVVVRINDRGPFVGNRIIDLSHKAARNIEMVGTGTAEVRLTIINPDPEHDRQTYLQERFTLQLGSFSRPEHAELIAGDLSGSRVSEAKVHDRIYYRVYYGLYATRREAEDALMAILKKGHSGFIKQL